MDLPRSKKWSVTSDKFLSLDQIERLNTFLLDRRDLAMARGLHHQAIKDHYMVRTLLETGVRVFEFCNLTNIDYNGLKLVIRHGKGGKARTVLLTRGTALLLKEWQSISSKLGYSQEPSAPLFPSRYGQHYTTRGVQKRVKAAFAAIGLPKTLSVHNLRHTYCSLLLASGKVGLATVKENLGHHCISITNLYAHAIGNLDGVDLYNSPVSEKGELAEPHAPSSPKKPKNIVQGFLGNANLKQGALK